MKPNSTPGRYRYAGLCLQMFSLFFCLSFIFTGCKKGDTGPAGPAGPQGPAGPTGSPNVQYSEWFTPASYTKTVVFGLNRLDYDQAAAALTQPVLDSGTVLVYGKLNGYVSSIWPTDQISLFPIIITYLSGTTYETDTWSAYTTVGHLRISFTNNNNLYGSLATTHQFRYIIVPGGVKLTNSYNPERQGQTQVNSLSSGPEVGLTWKDLSYQEVCAALNIQE